uniref:Small ribosomal subunit protein uS7c n=1 Tax=Chlamydomonas peterfii TaxID=28462 RepID=A0A0S2ICH2_9CHLO|nr:ribosomal protein S7 [Chlamydomonas peterfii]
MFLLFFCQKNSIVAILRLYFMPRRPISQKRALLPDPVYNNTTVHMLVNRVLKSGKKSIAYRIVYTAFKEIGDVTLKNPVEVFETALDNITPRVEVKPRRRAGAIQMVPRVLRAADNAHAKATSLRWILEACQKRSGQPMVAKLKTEILEAYKKTGFAIRKKEELHKLAINNAMYARKPQTVINAVNA